MPLLWLLVAFGWLPPLAQAEIFRLGPVDGQLDLNLTYGALYRTRERNPDSVAYANGGNSSAINTDDGTLNYDTGLVSNMFSGSAEVDLRWGPFNLVMRGIAFYDFEQEDEPREHRPFERRDLEVIGSDVTLRDFYLGARFSPGGMPIAVRIGDQVINWGESNFVRDGVDTINPLDIVGSMLPARSPRDVRIPQGMVWTGINITESFAIEAFYQYDWQPVAIPPAGYYLSTSDVTGEGRRKFAQLGGGNFSDLGTDLDGAFGLPEGTLGFDPVFLQLPQLADERPSDGGQYGLSLTRISQQATAVKWGVHYLRYHSRLPLLSGVSGSQEAADLTSSAALAQAQAELFPLYRQQGLSAPDAEVASVSTSELLSLNAYARQAGYFLEYPEDISMFAVTFNTATLRTGTLVAAELSHHRDVPLQLNLDDVISAALSPVQYTPDFANGSLGRYDVNTRIPGYVRLDRSQFALTLTQLLGRRLGAAQSLVGLDTAWVHIHHFPAAGEPQLQGQGGGDANSWGYRLLAQLQYSNVFGAANLAPRVVFIHDVEGYTPAPFASFWEGRKALSVGVGGDYLNRWTADLSYTAFFGGGKVDPLKDRDFIRFNLSFWF
ncbi:DUF1302 domain-containing protein [Aestuariicella hydrocarbonica]|uniref:DUF1302 domain-containing protein n=1 Tax=Pseudomaricurvus hydrocarbonicus TaxID=1470433 RepID=A0A9E5JTK1_9GAMM|nr:DUF1302 domain-containing protein [Aestuariicella hydrocarbonica]